MSSATISVDEWLAELERATKRKPTDTGFRTLNELCEILGMSHPRTRAKIKEAYRAGLIEITKEPRQTIFGDWRPQPVYRPVKNNSSRSCKRSQ